jgi:hypothetical protein
MECMVSPDLCNDAAGVLSSLCGQLFRQTTDPRASEIELNEEVLLLLAPQNHDLVELDFTELVKEWKASRSATSFSSTMAIQPAYLRIIGLGAPALPLILRELEKELDHWFVALKAISREDPVPPESRGKMLEMRDAWLKWGREKGHAW